MHSYPSWKAFIYLKPAKWLPQERISFNRLQWAQCGTQSDLSDRWGGGGPAIYSWEIVYLRAGVLKRLFYNSISAFLWNDSFDSWKWFCTISGPFMRTINVQRQLSQNTNTNHPDSGKMHQQTFRICRKRLSQVCGGACARVCITFIHIIYIYTDGCLFKNQQPASWLLVDVIARPKNGGCAVGRGLHALNGPLRKSKQ